MKRETGEETAIALLVVALSLLIAVGNAKTKHVTIFDE
jgi:hypothetical protein